MIAEIPRLSVDGRDVLFCQSAEPGDSEISNQRDRERPRYVIYIYGSHTHQPG